MLTEEFKFDNLLIMTGVAKDYAVADLDSALSDSVHIVYCKQHLARGVVFLFRGIAK